MAEDKTPFSYNYVLRTTIRHMIRDIDISISKTLKRFPEFVNNQSKSQEIFTTLMQLHKMRKDLEQFQKTNRAGNR